MPPAIDIRHPEIGWIASCNNKPDNTNRSQGFYFADRILRMHELLNSKDKFSIEDMKNYQFDLNDKFHFCAYPRDTATGVTASEPPMI